MAPPTKDSLKLNDMEIIVNSLFACSVQDLLEHDKVFDDYDNLAGKLPPDSLITLRKSIRVHDCRILFKTQPFSNSDIITILRAAFKRLNFTLTSREKSHKRLYRLVKNKPLDLVLHIQDVGLQGQKIYVDDD